MIRIYKPMVRRTEGGYRVELYGTYMRLVRLAPDAGRCLTKLRNDLVRQTGEYERGEPIVVELRPRTIVLRLKGQRHEMDMAYAELASHVEDLIVPQLSYRGLFLLMTRRENREEFLNRRPA